MALWSARGMKKSFQVFKVSSDICFLDTNACFWTDAPCGAFNLMLHNWIVTELIKLYFQFNAVHKYIQHTAILTQTAQIWLINASS